MKSIPKHKLILKLDFSNEVLKINIFGAKIYYFFFKLVLLHKIFIKFYIMFAYDK